MIKEQCGMKFRDIKSFSDDYKKLKKSFRWEIEDWIKENRLSYCYVRAKLDNDKIRLELSNELTVNELNGLLDNFGLRLAMKQIVITENISEEHSLYPIGNSKRIIYTFR